MLTSEVLQSCATLVTVTFVVVTNIETAQYAKAVLTSCTQLIIAVISHKKRVKRVIIVMFHMHIQPFM